MMKLESIVSGSRLAGILGDGSVEIIATRAYGPDAVEVTWKGPDGLGDRILYRDDEARLREVAPARRYAFDGDGHLFRLASEAFNARGGSARLLRRDELPADWDPVTDKRLTDWECAQHLARVLESATGGIDTAARLFAKMETGRSETARMLAYRLYDICERKDRAAEAQVWNMLAQEWPALEAAAASLDEIGRDGVLPLDMPGDA